jgi:hypothetical protein
MLYTIEVKRKYLSTNDKTDLTYAYETYEEASDKWDALTFDMSKFSGLVSHKAEAKLIANYGDNDIETLKRFVICSEVR